MAPRALVFFALLTGCGKTSEPAAEIDLERARTAVTDFFKAATDGDCTTVIRMRLTPLSADDCKEFVEHFGGSERGTWLTEIIEVKRDGRARNRAMVKANVSFAGRPHEWIVRVERLGDDYKVDVL